MARSTYFKAGLMASIAVVSVLMALAAACAPGESPTPTSEPSSGTGQATGASTTDGNTSVSGIPLDPEARHGGVLRTAFATEASFNQWEECCPRDAVQPLHSLIVQWRTWGTEQDYENEAYLELHPELALTWEQSSDGLQWTFRLRDGVTWPDGTPLTCADVKWSFDKIRTGEGLRTSPRALHWLAVDNIQCPDNLTVQINLSYPKPAFLEVVANASNVILPKHIYENDLDQIREHPGQVGAGPFVLDEWLPAEKTTFNRKTDYWNQPFPYLDRIEAVILNPNAQVTALRAGRLEFGAQNLRSGPLTTLMRECADCQFWPMYITNIPEVIMVNHQRAPWNQPEIMDAISLAIDRNRYTQLVFDGFGTAPYGGPFMPDSEWALPYERLKQIPGYDFETPEANKERARQLLAEAGYEPGELTMQLNVAPFNSYVDSPFLVEELTAVGFNVVVNNLERGRTYDLAIEGSFDVQTHGHLLGGLDPDFALYELWFSDSARNYNRYSNPEFERMVDEMSRTLDPGRRQQLAWDAAELALREHAMIIVNRRGAVNIAGASVRRWMPTSILPSPSLRHEQTWLAQQQ